MATTTPNYEINYDDPRFQQVDTEKNAAMTEMDNTYQGIIDNVDSQYQGLQDALKQNAETQKQNQQANTDFTIQKIEQQKDQTRQDYLKEQSGAYKDYVKQSDQYGANAEQMAASGMMNTGYSESSQVAMYNQYQNRVATAREVLSQAILNYDNNIKEAMLQNNSILAEIEANAALESAKLALEGFQYKNNLVLEQANKKIELDNIYYNRWQDVLTQMNTENAMKFEEAENQKNRDFEAAENKLDREFQAKQKELDRSFEEKMAAINRQHEKDMLKAKTAAEKELADYKHQQDLAKLEKEYEYDKKLLAEEHKNQKAYYAYQQSYKGSSGSGSSSSINKGSSSSSSSSSSINKGTSSSSSSSKETPVDQKTVYALGRGPITGKELANLVATNQVSAVQVGNEIKVHNNGPKGLAAGQALLDSWNWKNKAVIGKGKR